jgi:hypothetical protein
MGLGLEREAVVADEPAQNAWIVHDVLVADHLPNAAFACISRLVIRASPGAPTICQRTVI